MTGADEQAAADPRPQGQGPRRAADLRPRLAVGARLRRRRPAHRSAAPPVALADEGARPRGGTPHRRCQRAEADARAPLDGGPDRTGHAHRRPAARPATSTLEPAGAGIWRRHSTSNSPDSTRPKRKSDRAQTHRRRPCRHRRPPRDERGHRHDEKLQAHRRANRRRQRSGRTRRACSHRPAPPPSTCRASPCCRTPACSRARAGSA